MTDRQPIPAFTPVSILPARDGGFVVLMDTAENIRNEPLYAGSLVDCLEYLRLQLGGPDQAA